MRITSRPKRRNMSPPTPPISLTVMRKRPKRLIPSRDSWAASAKSGQKKRIRARGKKPLSPPAGRLPPRMKCMTNPRFPRRRSLNRTHRPKSIPAGQEAMTRNSPPASATTALPPPIMPRTATMTQNGRSTRPLNLTAKRTFSPPASRNTFSPLSPLCSTSCGAAPAALPPFRRTTRT